MLYEVITPNLFKNQQDHFQGINLIEVLFIIIQGDASLFTRSDGIEAAWQLVDPVLSGWLSDSAPPVMSYEPGSWVV